ncbi:polysaccharide deacetylase family protein [Falsibacillus albus]|uniref:Polysaccharide deacetylase family sporulation protein PdaB n=1 Tax=Falsibacillus albus TaxID=2478915 RepID=A0A3L7JPX1_9BACI|nr:polysaccharide deacetylase family protein [Falsibacillus albus]RLQ91721.1 polysaccharide deacetylase family sporulation protein PdaB [Falsibacillus albus]
MNFFVTLNGRNIKKVLLVIMISFFTALFFYSENLGYYPVFSTKAGPKAVYQGDKGIALTFNIGWGDVQAEPILDTLEKLNVKSATFFLSGEWAERHPDLVQRIVKQGYEVGSLGYSYADYIDLKDAEVRRDMMKSQEVFKKLNLKQVKLLRSPTGHFDKRTIKIADQLGLTVVHWSINSDDWKSPGVQNIVQNIEGAKQGDILLFHASDSAKQTAVALPDIISYLKKKGPFVSVSDMLANGNVKTTLVP